MKYPDNNLGKLLTQKRTAALDETWKLIVFSIGIFIWIAVFGLLGNMYYMYQEENTVISVMSNTNTTATELENLWLCDSTWEGAGVEYNWVSDTYAVTCGTGGEYNSWDDFLARYWQISGEWEDPSWPDTISGEYIKEYAVEQ